MDFLQVLINAADKSNVRQETDPINHNLLISQSKTWEFTDMHIMANMFQFLMAGQETVSKTLTFVFYLLAVHQEAQEICYDENMEVAPEGEVCIKVALA